MKRMMVFFLLLIICVSSTSCQDTSSDPCDLSAGTYYMVGDFEELMTPYLSLNFDDYTFQFGAGAVVSYAEIGSFVVKDKKVTATSQSTVFVFEITDTNTLILVDNGDNEYFQMPENSEFVLYKENNEG